MIHFKHANRTNTMYAHRRLQKCATRLYHAAVEIYKAGSRVGDILMNIGVIGS